MIEVASSFDSAWGIALEKFLLEDDGRRKGAIDSILNNRHLIAHGRSSSISVVQVREHFKSIEEVAEFIEKQLA